MTYKKYIPIAFCVGLASCSVDKGVQRAFGMEAGSLEGIVEESPQKKHGGPNAEEQEPTSSFMSYSANAPSTYSVHAPASTVYSPSFTSSYASNTAVPTDIILPTENDGVARLGPLSASTNAEGDRVRIELEHIPLYLEVPVSERPTLFGMGEKRENYNFNGDDSWQFGSSYGRGEGGERKQAVPIKYLGHFARDVILDNIGVVRDVAKTASRYANAPVKLAFGQGASTIFEVEFADFGNGLSVEGLNVGVKVPWSADVPKTLIAGFEYKTFGDDILGESVTAYIGLNW